MKTWRAVLLTVLLLFGGGVAHAQNDGDHLLTNGFGQSFLAPDAAVPGGLGILPFNLTVGNAASGNATLRVRGDQLPVNDAFVGTSLATFRTDVGNGNNQNWSMVRGAEEIGRLWHTNPPPGTNLSAFNVQARHPSGNLWLRNADGDGVVVHFNGTAGQ
ncbi:MAG TPA: hypothetical protein PKE21_17215 [Flavobacteriales bacterium]|nr:hypothetical protein [Flavobacteriales bacterium]HMR29220.1 hypothetical protein [Flavobacteriales bacterium]